MFLRLAFTVIVACMMINKVLSINPVLNIAAKGMGLLKPIFALENQLQAKVLTAVSSVDEADVDEELASAKKAPCVIYTYDLSPFSVEAINVLESTGAKFEKRSLGAEWFLLGPRQSLVRAKLLEQTGQSSLPHIFIGGEHIGGLSTGTPGLNSLAESGELTTMLKKAKALK